MADLHAALVAIQELHKPGAVVANWTFSDIRMCDTCAEFYPCPTRRLADDALGDDQDW